MKIFPIPALKKPTLKQLQKKYDWIQSIEKDDSTEKAVTLELQQPVKIGWVSGAEYEKLAKDANLGFQHMEWLIAHQDEFPELIALAESDNFWYITFPALVVVGRGGRRDVPYCSRLGSRWGDYWIWLDHKFDSSGRIACGQVADARKLTPSPSDPLTLSALEKRIKKLEDWKEKITSS